MDEKAETESEDHTLEEDTEYLVQDEDVEIFYHTNESEEEGLSPQPTIALVSEDQEAIEVPEGMVIEKRLPDLLSLLESQTGTAAPEVPIVPRPPTSIPPTPV